MIPVVFINCSVYPFLVWIMAHKKIYETRTRNMLGSLIGQTVYLAETGNGKPTVKCRATIACVEVVRTRNEFNAFRKHTKISRGSDFDWKKSTKVKYLYRLENVMPVPEFIPPEGVRHGRVWMEFDPGDYQQWIADSYHCSDIWGQKMTEEEMLLELTETLDWKDPGDYSPNPALYRECTTYWNALCDAYPN